jgi:hypothetical protein
MLRFSDARNFGRTFAVLLVGLGSLGWAALQMSDEEWDAPRAAAPAAPIAVAEPTPAV